MPRPDDLKIGISELFEGPIDGISADPVDDGSLTEDFDRDLRFQDGKTPDVEIFLAPHEAPTAPADLGLTITDAEPGEAGPEARIEPFSESPAAEPIPSVPQDFAPGIGLEAVSDETSAPVQSTAPDVSTALPETPTPASSGGPESFSIDFASFDVRPFAPKAPFRPASPGPLPSVPPKGKAAPLPPIPSAPPPAETQLPVETLSTATASVPDPEPNDPAREEQERRENAYLSLYDELRLMLVEELRDLVGDKKTKTMLSRTLEATRNKYPDYFRNANWDPEGNLLEDGSLDHQRLIHNKSLLDPARADALEDEALKGLLDLRLLAVEKGFGTGLRVKVHLRMRQWCLSHRDRETAEGAGPECYERLLAMLS